MLNLLRLMELVTEDSAKLLPSLHPHHDHMLESLY